MKKTTIILLLLLCISIGLNFYFFIFCCKDSPQVTHHILPLVGSDSCFGGTVIDEKLAGYLVREYKKTNAGSPCGFVLSKEAVRLMLEAAENDNCFTFDLAKCIDTSKHVYETNLIVRSWKYEPIDPITNVVNINYVFKTCSQTTTSSKTYMAYTLCPKICSNW